MASKVYVLVEVEDNCLSDTTVIGPGDVEIIDIDWDLIPNDPVEAKNKLSEILEAINRIEDQVHPNRLALAPLERAELRLREYINEMQDDEDEDEEEECLVCGELLEDCSCDEEDEDEDEDDDDEDDDDEEQLGINLSDMNKATTDVVKTTPTEIMPGVTQIKTDENLGQNLLEFLGG